MMRRWWLLLAGGVALYAAALHGLLALAVFDPDGVAWRLGFGEQVSARRSVAFQMRMRGHLARVDRMTPAGSVILLGASTVQGLAAVAVDPRAVNFGIGGETSLDVLARLRTYGSVPEAAAVVLNVGFNDLKTRAPAAVVVTVGEIMQVIPAKTPVVLSGIQKTAARVGEGDVAVANSAIVTLNAGLADLCSARPGCMFVDLYGLIEAAAPARLVEDDGIHLNAAGYEVWVQRLKEAVAARTERSADPY